MDLVVIAKTGAAKVAAADVASDFESTLTRMGLSKK
jgi:RNase P protein component